MDTKQHRRRMVRGAVTTALTWAAAVTVAGCGSSGLSPREVRGQDYATYVYSMYDAPPASAASPSPGAAAREPVATPAKIAVAQLGEVAPPAGMLENMRKDRNAFASVQPIPGVMNIGYKSVERSDGVGGRGMPTDTATRRIAAEQGQRMRRYASDVGADYLFLFGGSVDEATTNTPWVLADVTVIGAFVIPSEKLQAQARASGSLIDVRSGQVVLAVSADSNKACMSPMVTKESHRLDMLKSVRDDLTQQLADQLTTRIKEQHSRPAVNLNAG